MNTQIADRGALVDFSDGTQGVDPTRMDEEFINLYGRMTSIGYARGWID